MTYTMLNYPNTWKDRTCFIIGGGPSAKPAAEKWHDQIIESGNKIIAVNDAYLLFPEADILYFGDWHFYDWHREEILDFKGEIFTRSAKGGDRAVHFREMEKNDLSFEWSENPTKLGGQDSGHQAMNLAHHLGVSAIFLIGFDMYHVDGKANWHDRHLKHKPKGTLPEKYELTFVPGYDEVAKACERHGIWVCNLNPDSALSVFPKLSMEELFDGD